MLDNSSTHKTATIRAWLYKHPRFKQHFTPTSASWLNTAEGWFVLAPEVGLIDSDAVDHLAAVSRAHGTWPCTASACEQ